MSVLPPVTNTAGIVGEAPFGTQLKPSYTQDQVETILSAAPYERTIYPSDGTGAFKFVVNRDTGELAPLVDPISGDLIATFGATPDPDYAQHFIDGYQGGLRGDALEEFVDERLGISPDLSLCNQSTWKASMCATLLRSRLTSTKTPSGVR
jgi:hypothetical protein